MEQIDYIVSIILHWATIEHYAGGAMMQSYFPYLYIIDVRNNYLTEIYAINAILMEIDIYTSQCCQINIYIGHCFASKLK